MIKRGTMVKMANTGGCDCQDCRANVGKVGKLLWDIPDRLPPRYVGFEPKQGDIVQCSPKGLVPLEMENV